MRRLWNWLKSWWGLDRVSHQLSALNRRLDRLEKDKRDLEESLDGLLTAVTFTAEEVDKILDQIREEEEKAGALVKRYEVELEAARTQIQIYEELTIPTMTSQFKTVMETADALTAEQVRRRVAAAPTQEVIG